MECPLTNHSKENPWDEEKTNIMIKWMCSSEYSIHDITWIMLGEAKMLMDIKRLFVQKLNLPGPLYLCQDEIYLGNAIFTDEYENVRKFLLSECAKNNNIGAVIRTSIIHIGNIDPFRTTVSRQNLINWLNSYNIRPPFFFLPVKKQEAIPDYMNPEKECYSAKLHAAICAWEEVSTDPEKINKDGKAINGKSVKQNIENWLLDNIERFPILKKDDGYAKETVIKNEIGKIVNWDGDGGANKTPSRKRSGSNIKELKNK